MCSGIIAYMHACEVEGQQVFHVEKNKEMHTYITWVEGKDDYPLNGHNVYMHTHHTKLSQDSLSNKQFSYKLLFALQ